MSKTYRISEASKLTGYARSTIRKLIKSGEIKAEVVSVPWGGKFRNEYRIYAQSLAPYINISDKDFCKEVEEIFESGICEKLDYLQAEVDDLKDEVEQIKVRLNKKNL